MRRAADGRDDAQAVIKDGTFLYKEYPCARVGVGMRREEAQFLRWAADFEGSLVFERLYNKLLSWSCPGNICMFQITKSPQCLARLSQYIKYLFMVMNVDQSIYLQGCHHNLYHD